MIQIINNNIITYHSNNNINKIHNIYKNEEKSQRLIDNQNNINIIKEKGNDQTKFNFTRISHKEEILKFRNKIKNNLINNNSRLIIREPNDSKSKNLNNKRSSFKLGEKYPLNSINKNIFKQKPQSVRNKIVKKKLKKKCEFCGKLYDELDSHYKICNKAPNNEILKPRKKDTVLLDEKFNSESMEEAGIDESKQKILLREFKAILHVVNVNDEDYKNTRNINNGLLSNKIENIKLKEPESILKKKIEKLSKNKKFDKRIFPEDTKRDEYLIRTQEKINKNKNEEENLKTEIKNDKKRMIISYQSSPKNKNERAEVIFNNEKKSSKKRRNKSLKIKSNDIKRTLFNESDNL